MCEELLAMRPDLKLLLLSSVLSLSAVYVAEALLYNARSLHLKWSEAQVMLLTPGVIRYLAFNLPLFRGLFPIYRSLTVFRSHLCGIV